MSIDPATTAGGDGWWRRNRGWLPAAVLLAAASLGHAWQGGRADYALKNKVQALEVGKGQAGHYEGARWRVVDAYIEDTPDRRLRLHPDAAWLLVTFEVQPDAGTAAAALDGCQGQVGDAAGRRWNSYGSLPPGLPERLPYPCGGMGEAAPGGPIRFQHGYAIPRGLTLADLHPEIHFLVLEKCPRGQYLRFAL